MSEKNLAPPSSRAQNLPPSQLRGPRFSPLIYATIKKKILGADNKNNPEDSSFPELFLFEIRNDDICFSSYNNEYEFR